MPLLDLVVNALPSTSRTLMRFSPAVGRAARRCNGTPHGTPRERIAVGVGGKVGEPRAAAEFGDVPLLISDVRLSAESPPFDAAYLLAGSVLSRCRSRSPFCGGLTAGTVCAPGVVPPTGSSPESH
jgi:hypothetical protein